MAARILVVDDEIGVLQALKRLFQDEPWEVVTAHSGREALALMATRAVDVVISDERMPGMTGIELLAAVSRIYPETIRIILTGHDDSKLVLQAISDGEIYRFLTKPWDDEELIALIRQALAAGDNRTKNNGTRQ